MKHLVRARALLLILGALLIAWPAYAADWIRGATAGGPPAGAINPNSPTVVSFFFTDGTANDTNLSVGACSAFSATLNGEVGGTDTDATVELLSCPSDTTSGNSCVSLTTLNSNATTTRVAPDGYLRADPGTVPGGANAARLSVQCRTVTYSESTTIYDVTDPAYGAIPDAVVATCGTENPPICTTLGTGTDNAAAIQSAVTAALAVGGEVYIPSGLYRVDSAIQVYANGAANIRIRGEGRSTVLLPGWTAGDSVFEVCGTTGTTCDSTADITDVEITGIAILEDDPERSAHAAYVIVQEGTLGNAGGLSGNNTAFSDYSGTVAGTVSLQTAANHGLADDDAVIIDGTTADQYEGYYWPITVIDADEIYFTATWGTDPGDGTWGAAPAPGQAVDWNAGAENGDLSRYDFANGRISVNEDSGDAIAEGDTIVEEGANDWTATTTSLACLGDLVCGADTAAHTHGIVVTRGKRLKIHDNWFVNIGGSSVTIDSAASSWSQDVSVYDNVFENCPSLPSKETCIDTRGAKRTLIRGNRIEPGVAASYANQWALAIGNQNEGAEDTIIEGNIIVETGTLLDHIEGGIGFGPNNSAIINTLIAANRIEVDSPRGINSAQAVIGVVTAAHELLDVQISNNDITGTILLAGHASNTLSILGNRITCANSYGIQVSGTDVVIADNSILSCPNSAIRLVTTTVNASVTGNSIVGTTHTPGGTAGQIAISSSTAVTGHAVIAGNVIEGVNAAGFNIHGIFCNDETDVHAIGNTVLNSDFRGIVNCHIVKNNLVFNAASGGIALDGNTGAEIIGNTVEDSGAGACIRADDLTYSKIIGNTVSLCTDPGIDVFESAGSSDHNIIFGNVSLDSGEDILGGDGTSAGDDVGCTAEGGVAANTYCGGNIVTP